MVHTGLGCAGNGLIWIFGGAGLTWNQQSRAQSRRMLAACRKYSGLIGFEGMSALILS
jgi:hypothetical protein